MEARSYFGLTFSMPQNLSLPSLRIGPAFSSMRSRGVGWGAFGSDLDFAGELLLEFRPSCNADCQFTARILNQGWCYQGKVSDVPYCSLVSRRMKTLCMRLICSLPTEVGQAELFRLLSTTYTHSCISRCSILSKYSEHRHRWASSG